MTEDMTNEGIAARVDGFVRKTVESWKSLREFAKPPADVATQTISGLRDFNARFKVFEQNVVDHRILLQMHIHKKLGVPEGERLRKDIIEPKYDIIENAFPDKIRENAKIARCHYLVVEYLLVYVAASVHDKFGNGILSCYPQFGIPCGYDEDGDRVILYWPEF